MCVDNETTNMALEYSWFSKDRRTGIRHIDRMLKLLALILAAEQIEPF